MPSLVSEAGGDGTLAASVDIEGIYRRHVKTVYRLCYSHLGSSAEAEDATQSTFMRLIDHPRSFESEEHERAWLLVVAANVCKDLLKSAAYKRVQAMPEDGPEPASDSQSGVGIDPAETVGRDEDEVLKAVLSLPEKYKDVVYLFYYEGWKTDEIARMTSAPPSTVRNRLRDARKLLKEALGGERT